MAIRLLSIYKALRRRYGPQHWWPADTPLEVIIGAILTQNTAWGNVERAVRNLKRNRLLSVRALHRIPPPALARLVRPAGYFNIKARRLKNFILFLNENYQGNLARLFGERLPRLRRNLLSVNGIGPETADSIILYAAHKPSFVADAYTKRIFSRYGAFARDSVYSKIQAFFAERLPRRERLYNEYHALIVEHAKRTCLKKPKCRECVLKRGCQYGTKQLLKY